MNDQQDYDYDDSPPLCVKCQSRPRRAPYQTCSKECGRRCRIPECTERKHEGSLYCSHPHRKEAVIRKLARPCQQCGIYPQERDSVYCGKACTQAAEDNDTPPAMAIPMPAAPAAPAPAPAPPSPPTPSHPRTPLSPTDKRIPRAPKPQHVRPRSAYQVSFGEFRGNPNYLVRSKKGLAWANIPGSLYRLCKADGMAEKVLDFSLGTEGRFYFCWREGGEAKFETSPGLWADLDVDFQGGSIRQIQFGGEGTVWGIRSFRQYRTDDGSGRANDENPSMIALVEAPLDLNASPPSTGVRSSAASVGSRFSRRTDEDDEEGQDDFGFVQVQSPVGMRSYGGYGGGGGRRTSNASSSSLGSTDPAYIVYEEPFGRVPSNMVEKTKEVYPSLQHYGQVDFVACGVGGSWVIGVMGKLCYWDKLEGRIVEKLARVYEDGESLRNVVIAPTSNSIYVVEAKDGTVQYRVPDEWHPKIKVHLQPSAALDLDPVPRKYKPMAQSWQNPTQSRTGGLFRSRGSAGGSRPNALNVPGGGSGSNTPGRRPSPSPTGSGFSHHSGPPRQQQQYRSPPGSSHGSYDPNAPPPYVPYVPPPNTVNADPSQVYAQNTTTTGVIQAAHGGRQPHRRPHAPGHSHSQPSYGANGGGCHSANTSRSGPGGSSGACGHCHHCCQVQQQPQKPPGSKKKEIAMTLLKATPTIVGAGVQLVGLGMAVGCTIM